MLRAIAAAIRGAMRRLARMVWVTVELGGKLVGLLRYESGIEAAEPVAFDGGQVAEVTPDQRLSEIRELVLDYARNPQTPVSRMLRPGIGAATVAWIRALDPVQLARITCAGDAALTEHLAGKRSIKGVLPHDREAVEAYVRAKRRQAAELEPGAEIKNVLTC